jgi:hypothetical protein
MHDARQQPTSDRRSAGSKAKAVGTVAFTFFLAKGLLWLALPALWAVWG